MFFKKITYQINVVLFLAICFFSKHSFAQISDNQKQEIIQQIIERLVENTESVADYTDLQAQLQYYFENKINLNKATKEEFQNLIFLNQFQIQAIVNHKQKHGDFINVYELQAIDALDDETIYLLKHFVSVDETDRSFQLSELKDFEKGELIFLSDVDLQTKQGYKLDEQKANGNDAYLGSPHRYVIRFRQALGKHIGFGFTGEKDAGEQFFAGAQSSGFDFNSVHIHAKNIGKFKSIILGDYQANFGQGLTFGSGMASRKSAFVMNVNRFYQNIRPYGSVNENEFLRGAAFVFESNNWQITGFVSYKYINTNYRANDTTSNFTSDAFTGYDLSGYHRTDEEIKNKNNVLQSIYGLHLTKTFEFYKLGFTALQSNYDKSFLKGDNLYQQYNFSGNSLFNFGADYSLNLGNAMINGEFSYSDNNAFATSHNIIIPLDERFDFCLLYRKFDKNYQTTFNNPFAENSDGRNEEGIYTAIIFKPFRSLTFNTYIDIYRSPWLRYLVDAPSSGFDFLNEIQYAPNKKVVSYFRFRHETKDHNQSGNTLTASTQVSPQTRQQFRFHLKYNISSSLSTESRFEKIIYSTQEFDGTNQVQINQNGILIFQDLNFKILKNKLTTSCRLAIFDIEDYNARIYAFEDNVPYSFSVPLYQNSGTRYYIMLRYHFTKNMDFYLRYSQTTYSNVSSISSGLEMISGNNLQDLKMQFQWKF